jgi:hypothetical protein
MHTNTSVHNFGKNIPNIHLLEFDHDTLDSDNKIL